MLVLDREGEVVELRFLPGSRKEYGDFGQFAVLVDETDPEDMEQFLEIIASLDAPGIWVAATEEKRVGREVAVLRGGYVHVSDCSYREGFLIVISNELPPELFLEVLKAYFGEYWPKVLTRVFLQAHFGLPASDELVKI